MRFYRLQKSNIILVCLVLAGLLAACGDATATPNAVTAAVTTAAATTSAVTTAALQTSPAATTVVATTTAASTTSAVTTGPASNSQFSKEAVAEALKKEGATLNFYWPAGGTIKTWITDKLIPGYKDFVKETYGVDINVNILASGGGDGAFFQKLTAYEQANPNGGKDFDIDVVRVVPAVDLLDAGQKGWLQPILPDYAGLLPNLGNVNKPGLESFTTSGKTYAIPVYQPTISFFYNKDKVASPPQSVAELLVWAKANPRRFTYEDPRGSSGIGSGAMFLTTVMKTFGDPDKPETYDKGFSFLKDLQEYAYPQPTESAQMVELMKRGDIWLMAFWNDFGLSSARDQNITFMANYFPKEGTPVRNTPIAVPRSAAHKLAGLLFVNFALSDKVQRDLALLTQQVPASVSSGVWKDLPTNTFGYEFSYIQSHTFAAFNSKANLAGIKAMVDQYPKAVLGK
jgi:putative spermidine/putrescine transport system substrate-binding protein